MATVLQHSIHSSSPLVSYDTSPLLCFLYPSHYHLFPSAYSLSPSKISTVLHHFLSHSSLTLVSYASPPIHVSLFSSTIPPLLLCLPSPYSLSPTRMATFLHHFLAYSSITSVPRVAALTFPLSFFCAPSSHPTSASIFHSASPFPTFSSVSFYLVLLSSRTIVSFLFAIPLLLLVCLLHFSLLSFSTILSITLFLLRLLLLPPPLPLPPSPGRPLYTTPLVPFFICQCL